MAVFKKLKKGGVVAQFGGFAFRELVLESIADEPDDPDNPNPDEPNPDEPDDPDNPNPDEPNPDEPDDPDEPGEPSIKKPFTVVHYNLSNLKLASGINNISATATAEGIAESDFSTVIPIYNN